MPRTVRQYQQRWQRAMAPDATVAPWDEPFSPTSCVIHESAHTIPMGTGCSYFADFGDVICFYRYLRIPEELDTTPDLGSDVAGLLPGIDLMQWTWSRYRSRYSTEEIRRRRYEGERALDKLLVRFVRGGYRPEMGENLIEIVNETLIDFALDAVYVLPDDLPALLERVGNPLGLTGVPGNGHLATTITTFDLNALGHREALAEYLVEGSR